MTRFVFENPYPLGGGLIVIALVVGGLAIRDARLDRLKLALIPLVLGSLVLATGMLVTTSGEEASAATRQLVENAMAGDIVAVDLAFSDRTSLHVGSARNAGRDVTFIRDRLSRFAQRFTVDDNRISALEAYTVSPDQATVHLGLWTSANGVGPSPSRWVLEWTRAPDGAMTVEKIVWVSFNLRPPPAP